MNKSKKRNNKKKAEKNKVLAAMMVVILIVSGISFYFISLYEEKGEKKEEEVKEIDDRISPNEDQTLFLEVQRIRKKGIIEVMEDYDSTALGKFLEVDVQIDEIPSLPIIGKAIGLAKPDFYKYIDGLRNGNRWDQKPSYRYVATMDGYTYEAPEVYNEWDTKYIFHNIFMDVAEEQETAVVEFKIVENVREKAGLFRTSVSEQVMDAFTVTYDFRTGRWMGSDSMNDSDGYRHYDGEHYEIWFDLKQADSDWDGIPYWTEVNVLGTNPNADDRRLDPDGDGLPTAWEWEWGYDPFVWDNHTYLDPDMDGLQNVEEYIMRRWLANPYTPQMYLEVDSMEKAPFKPLAIERVDGKILPRVVKTGLDGWDHIFYEETQQMLIDRYAEHGIYLHIDYGVMGGGGERIPFKFGGDLISSESGVAMEWYHTYFDKDRQGIFRYAVYCHNGGWAYPADYRHTYDFIVLPSSFMFNAKTLDLALSERTKRIGMAIGMIHELGHTVGFGYGHTGGVDNFSVRYNHPDDYPWFEYVSVMNYEYFRMRYFDYSDGSHGPRDTDDWGNIRVGYFEHTLTSKVEVEGIDFDDRDPRYKI